MKKASDSILKDSRKKVMLLTAAEELFHDYGFEKVSVDEICIRAKASKMTFYRQFKDKVDIALYLLETRNVEAKEPIQKMLSEKIPFSEKFKSLVQMQEQYSEKMGLRFLEDLSTSTDPRIIEGIQLISKKLEQLNLKFIQLGKAEGFFDPKFSTESILFLVQQINAIFRNPALKKFYPNFSDRTEAIRQFFYYGITSKRERAKS